MIDLKDITDEAKGEIDKKIKEVTSLDNIKKEAVKRVKSEGKKIQRKAEKKASDVVVKSAKEEIDKRIKGSGSLEDIKDEALKKAQKANKEIRKASSNPVVKSAKNQMMKSVKNKMMKK